MRVALARALGRRWGDLRHAVARGEHRRTAAALAAALPDLDPPARRRLLREAFRHRGAVAWEERATRRFDLVTLCRHLSLEGWEHLQEAETAGRGVLLLTSALGYPGIAARAVGAYAGPVLPAAGDRAALERVLAAGGKAMVVLDRPPERGEETVTVPFLGGQRTAAATAARLALATAALAVPIFALPAPGGRYRLVIRPAILPPERPAEPATEAIGACVEDVSSLTARYLAALAAEVRRRPELWPWSAPG